MGETPSRSSVELAAELTTAWLSNPNVRASSGDGLAFLNDIHGALLRLGEAEPRLTKIARPGLSRPTTDHLAPSFHNDGLAEMLDDRSHAPVTEPSNHQIPFELRWDGASARNTESFDDLKAAKDRARELINSGEATSASLSDSGEMEVASFVKLTPILQFPSQWPGRFLPVGGRSTLG